MSQDPAPTAPSQESTRSVRRRIFIGVGAALLAGVISGLVARGLMRLATLAIGEEAHFTVGASAGIVALFAVVVMPGAVARALGARRTGVVLLSLGAGFVALQCVAIGTQDLGHVEFTPAVTAAMVAIGAGFLVAVVGLALLAWRFASSWTARPRH